MAEISRLSRLAGGIQRHVDLASNTLVVLDIKIGGGAGTLLTQAILNRLVNLQNGTDVDATYHTHDGRYFTETELGSTSNPSGASRIGVEDAGALYTAANVEAALAEVKTQINAHENGGANKHDATEVDYERTDGSKKDIQAASDDVETALTDLDDNKISKTGSIAFTGDQSMGGNQLTNLGKGTGALEAVSRDQVVGRDDNSSDYSATSKKIINVADPTVAQDAATKAYVDGLLDGRDWKQAARASTTAVLPAVTYNNGAGTLTADANGALAAQDGITLVANDTLLVKDQASAFQNGLYVVTQVGDGSNPFILTRRSDANTGDELEGAAVFVEEGTANADKQYAQTSDNVTLGTTGIVWVLTSANSFSGHDMISMSGGQISVDLASDAGLESTNPGNAAGQLRVKPDATGGANLAKAVNRSANGLAVKVDDTTVEGDSGTGQLRVKDAGISTAKIAADAVDDTKIRARNNQFIRGRNQAGSADINIIKVRTDDALELGTLLHGEIAYTPADATDWNGGTDPGNVDDGLDQLADRVKTLETNTTDTEALSEVVVLGESLSGVTGIRAFRYMRAADAGFVAGRVKRADNDATTVDNFHSIGLYIAAADASGASITVVKMGRMTVTAHGFTAGEAIYLGANGVLTNTAPTTADFAVVLLGYARDANTLEVKVQIMGVN